MLVAFLHVQLFLYEFQDSMNFEIHRKLIYFVFPWWIGGKPPTPQWAVGPWDIQILVTHQPPDRLAIAPSDRPTPTRPRADIESLRFLL